MLSTKKLQISRKGINLLQSELTELNALSQNSILGGCPNNNGNNNSGTASTSSTSTRRGSRSGGYQTDPPEIDLDLG